MIEAHPRFRAPDRVRVPARYCGAAPVAGTADPAQDVNRIQALQGNGIITISHHPASAEECKGAPQGKREAFVVTLTEVGANFHPATLSDGRGWEFDLARRQFVSVHDISYNSSDPPTLAHVGFVWAWEPNLLGQLLQVGSVQQGASATFTREDGEPWTVLQPGM